MLAGMEDPTTRARVLKAMRANLLPGIALWLLAALIVGAYYHVPALRPGFAAIAGWKAAGGFLFSAILCAFAGGLLPWLVARALGRNPDAAELGFLLLSNAYHGVEVDALYRLLTWCFGDTPSLAVVTQKVAIDILIYSTFWSTTYYIVLMAWKDGGYTRAAWSSAVAWSTIRRSWLPMVAALWLVWIPTCSLLYCLPGDLQIPLFSIVTTFWVLVFLLILSPPPAKCEPQDG